MTVAENRSGWSHDRGGRHTWSIIAVEAALRIKLGADQKVQLSALVKTAEREGYLPARGWDDGRLDAGRQLRNAIMHGGQQQLWTPAMAREVIAASHEAIAALFPDEIEDSPSSESPEP